MTSSPSPMPQMRKFSSSAAVAELRQTTLLVWQYSASFFSNALVRGPVVIQPERKASATSAISSSEMSGGLKGMFLFAGIGFAPFVFSTFVIQLILFSSFCYATSQLSLGRSISFSRLSAPTSTPHFRVMNGFIRYIGCICMGFRLRSVRNTQYIVVYMYFYIQYIGFSTAQPMSQQPTFR